MNNIFKKLGIVGLILLALGGALLAGWQLFPGWGRAEIVIDVPSGSNAHRVGDELVEGGLLQSKIPFLIWTKLRGAEQKIKIGRYEFKKGRSAFWILDDLIEGRTLKIKVIIPEGFSSWQIAERLEESGLVEREAFLSMVKQRDLEGYLFPATYEFDWGQPPAAYADLMKAELDRRWTSEVEAKARARGWNQKETLTMASIIEREVMRREELPLVSALYNNRLKKGMLLEADPTVQFAKGEWVSRLLYSDYRKTKSPYNTYLNKGLPPGPICSPGFDAVEAALSPAAADHLFMVAKPDGFHDFSHTYREHVNKVNQRNRRRRLERLSK